MVRRLQDDEFEEAKDETRQNQITQKKLFDQMRRLCNCGMDCEELTHYEDPTDCVLVGEIDAQDSLGPNVNPETGKIKLNFGMGFSKSASSPSSAKLTTTVSPLPQSEAAEVQKATIIPAKDSPSPSITPVWTDKETKNIEDADKQQQKTDQKQQKPVLKSESHDRPDEDKSKKQDDKSKKTSKKKNWNDWYNNDWSNDWYSGQNFKKKPSAKPKVWKKVE